MWNSESEEQSEPGEICPTCHQPRPSGEDNNPEPSTPPINPLAVSFTEDAASVQDNDTPGEVAYDHIDGDYERAEEDAAEKLEAVRTKLYYDRVWSRAVWRKVTSSSKNNFANVRDRAEKAIPPVPQVFGRVLAARINVGSIIRDSSSKVYSRMSADTKKDEMASETYVSSSESSRSSGAPYPDDEDLLQFVNTIETDNYWTFLETPDVEDDWDMLPEADRTRHVRGSAPTFNSEMRDYYEKQRAKRKAEREENLV
jgi:hypothetical protein